VNLNERRPFRDQRKSLGGHPRSPASLARSSRAGAGANQRPRGRQGDRAGEGARARRGEAAGHPRHRDRDGRRRDGRDPVHRAGPGARPDAPRGRALRAHRDRLHRRRARRGCRRVRRQERASGRPGVGDPPGLPALGLPRGLTARGGGRELDAPGGGDGEARPDAPRAGDPPARRRRALEREARTDAVGDRADGEVPPLERLPEARRRQPHRGCALGAAERPAVGGRQQRRRGSSHASRSGRAPAARLLFSAVGAGYAGATEPARAGSFHAKIPLLLAAGAGCAGATNRLSPVLPREDP
jgi:hypothetical protein